MVVLIFLTITTTDCKVTYKHPIHTINLSETEDKLYISVDLIITDELKNAKWEFWGGMGNTILPLGENLVYHIFLLFYSYYLL